MSQFTVQNWLQELSGASPFHNSQGTGLVVGCFSSRLNMLLFCGFIVEVQHSCHALTLANLSLHSLNLN